MIRKAILNDLESIWNLGSNVNEFEVSKETVTFWPKDILELCINSGAIFVSEGIDEINGFIVVNYNPDFKKAIIENIFVDSKFRGMGIGEDLLMNLLKYLREKGCEYVCSLVEEKDNTGINFYLKNNFNRGINCVWLDLILENDFRKNN